MNTFIDNQNWRYATKKFDATKKVSDADLAILKEAIQLTASSYGLQPYVITSYSIHYTKLYENNTHTYYYFTLTNLVWVV